MRLLFRVAIVLFAFSPTPSFAEIRVFEDTTIFLNAVGPIEHFLLFRTDKSGTDHFNRNTREEHPGTYFSDLVSFSSPESANPANVLWGHFDGEDGGIGSLPDLFTPLRLDFATPVLDVGFRNRGMQPGINVQYFDAQGQRVGEVAATVSSFIAVRSTIPIAYLLVQEDPPPTSPGRPMQPSYISYLQFNSVPEPSSAMLLLMGLSGLLAASRWMS
jgi:PEP-CTERM motif